MSGLFGSMTGDVWCGVVEQWKVRLTSSQGCSCVANRAILPYLTPMSLKPTARQCPAFDWCFLFSPRVLLGDRNREADIRRPDCP